MLKINDGNIIHIIRTNKSNIKFMKNFEIEINKKIKKFILVGSGDDELILIDFENFEKFYFRRKNFE